MSTNVLPTSRTNVGKVHSKKVGTSINRPRQPLQVLQQSASDKTVLVSSPKMVIRENCSSASSTKHFTIPEDKVELKKGKNVEATNDNQEKKTSLRRSARKNASTTQHLKPIKDKPPVLKQKKTRKTKVKLPPMKEMEVENSNLNQSTLDVFFPAVPKSNDSENTEELQQTNIYEHSIQCIRSIHMSEEVEMLTSDEPSVEHLSKLSESRRVALEKALYENAQLHDEIEVLQTENMKLKEIVEEAKVMAVIINGMMDGPDINP